MSDPAREAAGRSTSVQALEPGPHRQASHYWGPQWSVQADLSRKPPKLPISFVSHLSNAADSMLPNARHSVVPRSELESPAASRRDLVEEWQARQRVLQRAPDIISAGSDMPNTPESSDESPAISGIYEAISKPSIPTVEQGENQSRRLAAMLMPIRRPYVGGAAVVSIGLYMLLRLGDINIAAMPSTHAQPSRTVAIQSTSDTRTPLEELGAAQVNIAAKPSVPAPDAIIGTASTPASVSPKLPPLPDTATGSVVAGIPLLNATRTAPVVIETKIRSARNEAGLRSAALPPHSVDIRVPADDDPALRMQVEAALPPTTMDRPLPGSEDTSLQAPSQNASISLKKEPPTVFLEPDASARETGVLAKLRPLGISNEPRISAIDTAAFLARGDALLGTGDIASARLFYERAAEDGNAQAALRLGETFDPAFLAHARLNWMRGDSAIALKWYKRAQELGASEADILVINIERN